MTIYTGAGRNERQECIHRYKRLYSNAVSDDINYNNAQGFLKTVKDHRLVAYYKFYPWKSTYFCRSHDVAVEMAELIMNNPLIIFHESVPGMKRQHGIFEGLDDKEFSYTDPHFRRNERLRLKAALL